MSRREIYRRTKGYSIFGVVNAKMFFAVVILGVIALGLKNPQLILDSDSFDFSSRYARGSQQI